MESTLIRLEEGQTATVLAVGLAGDGGRRLLDLGFTPGARVTRLFSAPSGDPVAYLVRGSVIAIRREDAALVAVG